MDHWRYIGEYCSAGFNIFPLAHNAKLPAIKGGRGCLDASNDENQIADWFQDHPDRNLGIATGEASGIVVIDIDVKDEAGGKESVAGLAAEGRIFPRTAEVKTPSGGRHLYYTYHRAINVNSAGTLASGIDIRSNGGYIVAPPSEINGAAYQWVNPLSELRRPPMWLVFTLLAKQEPKRFEFKGDGDARGLLDFVSQSPKGERNSRLFWAACRMGEKQDIADSTALLLAAKSCGLGEFEARKTIRSGMQKGQNNGG